MGDTIPLGRYLWERIRQLGIHTILGVPGDFNLHLLDHIYTTPGLRWVGNANELNAAYCADGYGRVSNLPGVFVTTHGVGELSALNGVAGSYSEQVKVIHVVGQTTRKMQDSKALIHHSIEADLTIGPDHGVYSRASDFARAAEARLWDLEKAPAEIDRVIRECFIHCRPVYIFVPLDLADRHVPMERLNMPIDITLPVDQKAQETAVKELAECISKATSPCMFLDILVTRHNANREAIALAEKLQCPVFTSTMAKGIIDETHPLFVGVYNGQISTPGVCDALEKNDCIIVLGSLAADTNTGGFSRKFADNKTLFINPHDVTISSKVQSNTFIKPLLSSLISALPSPSKIFSKTPLPNTPSAHPSTPTDVNATHITQSWLWHHLAKNFLAPGDIVFADTGTATFGLGDTQFPKDVTMIHQTYYGSIGWATPSALGSEIALQDLLSHSKFTSVGVDKDALDGKLAVGQEEWVAKRKKGRTVLFTGDGSLLLTIQDISVMIKAETKPIIFIINNAGYTIERVIHGASQTYNDIPPLDYKYLLPLMGHKDPDNAYFNCATKKEVLELLRSGRLENREDVVVVELMLEQRDVPWRLSHVLSLRGPENVEYLKRERFIK